MNWLALLALGTFLAACGGGGGDPSLGGGNAGGGASAMPATVVLSLSTAAGQASNTISSGAPLTAKAIVSDKNGVPVSNALVTFSADSGLVSLSITNGAVLTDAKGWASLTVSAATASVTGAGKLTATVAAGTTILSSDANYEIKAATVPLSTAGAQMTLSLLSSGSASNSLSGTTPLTAQALLTDATDTASVTLRPFSLWASGATTLRATATTNDDVLAG